MLDRFGVLAAILAYTAWGFFPLYWQLLKHVSPLETMSHRVIWSLAFYLVVASRKLTASGAKAALGRFFLQRDLLWRMALASILIAFNWLLYVWGVTHGHVMETSLGYFINPLISVAIGNLILRERLRPLQWAALALAAIGVTWLTIDYGRPPWIALGLAFSFAGYGFIKKVVKGNATIISSVETLILLPLALIAAVLIRIVGPESDFQLMTTPASLSTFEWVLLIGGGAVTGIPLLLFGIAAQRLPLSTLGFFQYLAPTFQFLSAVFFFHEPLPQSRLAGFVLIWIALAVFLIHLVRSSRTLNSD